MGCIPYNDDNYNFLCRKKFLEIKLINTISTIYVKQIHNFLLIAHILSFKYMGCIPYNDDNYNCLSRKKFMEIKLINTVSTIYVNQIHNFLVIVHILFMERRW